MSTVYRCLLNRKEKEEVSSLHQLVLGQACNVHLSLKDCRCCFFSNRKHLAYIPHYRIPDSNTR